MKKTQFFVGIAVCLSLLASCKQKSTINNLMEKASAELLRDEMKKAGIDSAVIMVMSVPTGEMLVQMKLVNDFAKGAYVRASDSNLDQKVEPGPIVIPLMVMGALDETGKNLDQYVDTGNGHLNISQRSIYDEDVWGKGGHGVITLSKSLSLPSFVGVVRYVDDTYTSDYAKFLKRMNGQSFGAPDKESPFTDVPDFPAKMNAFSLGFSFKMSPTQLITSYNAIANNGRMVAPTLIPGETTTINEAVCKPEVIKTMQDFLLDNASKKCKSNIKIAFYGSVNSIKKINKRMITGSYCGYYPVDLPKYTCLVTMYYSESPDADPKAGKKAVDAACKQMFFDLCTFK